MALYRNLNGDAEYWGGRPYDDWEVSNPITGYVFTAPASDVFGLVIFGKTINGSGTYSVEIERYDDCAPLPTNPA